MKINLDTISTASAKSVDIEKLKVRLDKANTNSDTRYRLKHMQKTMRSLQRKGVHITPESVGEHMQKSTDYQARIDGAHLSKGKPKHQSAFNLAHLAHQNSKQLGKATKNKALEANKQASDKVYARIKKLLDKEKTVGSLTEAEENRLGNAKEKLSEILKQKKSLKG